MRSLLVAALLVFAIGASAAGPRDFERGFPLIETHDQRRHSLGMQVFSVTQDGNGTLYFGGLGGIGIYDGAWWRQVPLPNDSAVYSVAGGSGPEVAIGGIDEFGWAAPDANGTIVYHSLLPHLPPAQRAFGDVRAITSIDGGFVFATERLIIVWNGGVPRVIAELQEGSTAPPRAFRHGRATYLALASGLHRVNATATALERTGFAGRAVEQLLPYDDTRMLAVVSGEGAFLTDGTTEVPFAPEATAWLRDKSVTTGCVLADGRFVLGTRQDGILILQRSGAIEQRLDAGAGLPGQVLTGAYADREGSLWLTYHGTIARVDLDASMSLLDARRGLRGSPSAAAHHRGRLYISSSHGLFVTDPALAASPDPADAIRQIAGVPGSVWNTYSAGDELLAATSDGVFILDANDTPRRVDGTQGLAVYNLGPSPSNASRVWLATKRGIAHLQRNPAGWRFGGFIAGAPGYIRHVVEHEGVLYAGTVFDGIARIDLALPAPPVRKFGRGEMDVALIDGRVVVIGERRILELRRDGTLAPDPRLGHIHGVFDMIAEDANGNVWTNGLPAQFVPRLANGRYATHALPLVGIDTTIKHLVPDGEVMWLDSGNVLFRFEAAATRRLGPQPAPLVRIVSAAGGEPVARPLPHAFGRVRIEFAPLSYRPGILYQYRLDPVDRGWSEWTSEPSIDYTNLDSAGYTFRLRARGPGGQVSAETERAFRVLAPWYRTRWAAVLWVLLAAIVVAVIVRLRTTTLQRQADRLRVLIEERTEDLLEANAHLERLSLLDDLTGIANRRYFQRALGEDWRAAYENRQPLALLLFDLDHFKKLNDERGHPAGDAALVQVARFLSRQVRRSGELATRVNDLVARIGGEEFAVLLTQTDEDEAVRVADSLRHGLAELPLLIGSSTVHITVSCGVAAVVPNEAEGWNALMSHADRALYAAKAAGRNCVRAASDLVARKKVSSGGFGRR